MILRKSTEDIIFFTTCLFYYFKVLGIAPISLYIKSTKKSASQCVVFTRSNRALVYDVVLILNLVTANIYKILYLCLRVSSTKIITIEAVTNCLEDFVTCLSAVFILIIICFSREKLSAMVNAISGLTECLDGFGVENPKKHKLQLEIGMIILVNITTWILVFVTTAVAEFSYLLYDTIMYSNVIVVNALLIQYGVVLKLLRHNFKMLNENLLVISQEVPIKIQSPVESNRRVERLSQLRKLHASMCKVSRDVSNYYSYPALACVVCVFYTLIYTCYYLTRPIVLYDQNLRGDMFVMSLVYGLLLVFSVVILTKSVTATIDESDRTKEIINAGLLRFEDDEKMSKKLNQFSSYLLHTDVKFKVSKLFSLDDSLLTSMASSIATYLVIVLQFLQK
ncbi:gustatory receptor 43 [Nasonia vitripennis]|uniref:Gustatory receptor n=1 Tax=Nasonia vitripennis TaxID=7425 RepID=A0A7M6UGS3_NASVI|nr:gustatory receptor 43 [Nasonia vitripennis]